MKYTVILSEKQFRKYQNRLISLKARSQKLNEEIALLSIVTKNFIDKKRDKEPDPVGMLLALMENRGIKRAALAKQLRISPGIVSDIICYRRGFSKNIIRMFSEFFNVSQEVFNKPYKLKTKGCLKNRKRLTALFYH